jgi:FkbM family methyltransferase
MRLLARRPLVVAGALLLCVLVGRWATAPSAHAVACASLPPARHALAPPSPSQRIVVPPAWADLVRDAAEASGAAAADASTPSCPGAPARCRACADPEAWEDTARRLAESAVWQQYLDCGHTGLPSFVPGRRHFFFDFGAANGNSMDVFLRRAASAPPTAEPPFLFPTPMDVPPYLFVAYLFEGNPFFNGPLTDYVAALARELPPIVAHAYNSTLAAAADGTIPFYVDRKNVQHNYWGSSILAEHPDVQVADRIDLPAVDVGALIRRVTCPEDYVVVKMDIEGAEYAVIESWCTRPAIWRHIDLLYMEVHEGMKGPTDAQLRAFAPCLAYARALGVIIPPYSSVS